MKILCYTNGMNTERYTTLNQALEQILAVLRAEYHPEKVILFGSMADGTVSEWSDIDLLIVKNSPLPFMQRLKEVALLCRASVGVDYLVYTPDEIEQMKGEQNPFILDVLQKGRVLHERRLVA